MGIYDRDYYREETSRRRVAWGDGSGAICKKLIAINVVIYLLQVFASPSSWLTDLFKLDPIAVTSGFQIWRLLTYGFCHSLHPMHVAMNMLLLWWFGRALESMYGSREFLRFYLVSIIVSGLFFLAVQLAVHHPNPAIGASGGVMAVLVVYAIHFPRQTVLLFFVIPVPIALLVGGLAIYDLAPVLSELRGMPTRDNIAHSAHLGGLLFGFVYKQSGMRLERYLVGWKLPRIGRMFASRPKVKIYREPPPSPMPEDLDVKVDRILKKITAEGEESLSEDERRTLTEASRRYRDRNRT